MIRLYAVVSAALALAALPWVGLAAVLSRDLRSGLWERLAPLPRTEAAKVWIHAASVGEVEAAAPLIRELSVRGIDPLLTTLTATGRARLRSRFPELGARLAPVDLPILTGLSLRRARVRVLVLIETELWPNTLAACRTLGVRVAILSGRLSDRSFPRYRRIRRLLRPILGSLWRLGAQSELDRERFLVLGVPADRAETMGDLKLDCLPAGPPAAGLVRALGPGPFLLAASTHEGEERAVLRAWRALVLEDAPGLRLILAPRHPTRAPSAVRAAERLAAPLGLRVGLRSRGAACAEIVVLDTLGELASLYSLADLVFCGGTLAPVGGHTLLEAVRAGRSIVVGPHLENQRGQVRLLEPLGVLHRVESEDALTPALRALWRDPERHAPARRAAEVLEAHRGATARGVEIVCEALDA
ncbi:MAG: 3-deoxy-D-manno-octulosonic acid transferase [Myxococcota bacterium]